MRYSRLAYAPLAATTVMMANPLLARAADFGAGSVSITPSGTTGPDGSKKFSVLIGQIFTIFIWVAGVAAIFYLLISGFQYITAGGDGDKAAKARTGIVNAIIGIIILMAAFFIFRAATNVGGAVGNGTGAEGNL